MESIFTVCFYGKFFLVIFVTESVFVWKRKSLQQRNFVEAQITLGWIMIEESFVVLSMTSILHSFRKTPSSLHKKFHNKKSNQKEGEKETVRIFICQIIQLESWIRIKSGTPLFFSWQNFTNKIELDHRSSLLESFQPLFNLFQPFQTRFASQSILFHNFLNIQKSNLRLLTYN